MSVPHCLNYCIGTGSLLIFKFSLAVLSTMLVYRHVRILCIAHAQHFVISVEIGLDL